MSCWDCGTPLKHKQKRYCLGCEEFNTKVLDKARRGYDESKDILALERALVILEKQDCDMGDYKESVDVVSDKMIEKPGIFQSSYEMVAAIELLRNRTRIKTQYKVGAYRVDLALPEESIFLEIDGQSHNLSMKHDKERDIKIRLLSGPEWEVVRMPTKYLEKNIKQLLPAIREIRDFQQDVRERNHGLMPKWFSARDERAWRELAKTFNWKPRNVEADRDEYIIVGA